jgi:hypothetical protein
MSQFLDNADFLGLPLDPVIAAQQQQQQQQQQEQQQQQQQEVSYVSIHIWSDTS